MTPELARDCREELLGGGVGVSSTIEDIEHILEITPNAEIAHTSFREEPKLPDLRSLATLPSSVEGRK